MKFKSNKIIDKYRAKVVTKSFQQTVGINNTKTFNLMVNPTTIRIMLIVSIIKNCLVRQLNDNTIFLNGDIEDTWHN